MKTIVTHLSPDFDAITSCWLIKKFLSDWQDAMVKFVPAGSTLDNKSPDEDPEIIHVDTGLGKFDHHQLNEVTSATKLVFQYLLEKDYIKNKLKEPLERIVDHVNEIDRFAENYYPDPTSDRYDFLLSQLIEGLKSINKDENELIELVFLLLDAELNIFRNKVSAENEIKQGFVFQTKLGKSIIMETKNRDAVQLALKMKYDLVIQKDPEKGHVRIKCVPKKELDLSKFYNIIKKSDPKATWFLHISKHMLLNGSSKNPNTVPSSLSVKTLIEIAKNL